MHGILCGISTETLDVDNIDKNEALYKLAAFMINCFPLKVTPAYCIDHLQTIKGPFNNYVMLQGEGDMESGTTHGM